MPHSFITLTNHDWSFPSYILADHLLASHPFSNIRVPTQFFVGTAKFNMPSLVVGLAILSVLYAVYQYVYKTDKPKIKGVPEIPGLPLFGSLVELGEYHAKVAQRWAEKYGPVFQVRLGNRVCFLHITNPRNPSSEEALLIVNSTENRLCELLPISPPLLDHASIRSHLSTDPPYLPHPRVRLGKFYHWDVAMGRLLQTPP